jgi:hypothetical protein
MTEPELQTQLQAQLQTELDPDFQIVRLLGEGSMALVYVAREKALQRLVAIKVLKAELAKDEWCPRMPALGCWLCSSHS